MKGKPRNQTKLKNFSVRKGSQNKRKSTRSRKVWTKEASAAGISAAEKYKRDLLPEERIEETDWMRGMISSWVSWFRSKGFSRFPGKSYSTACRRFINAYCRTLEITPEDSLLLMPTEKTTGCVITAMNEQSTLQMQLDELARFPFNEIIVVLNGSTDGSYSMVCDHPVSARVVHFDSPLGHDVGRAIGAKEAHSDFLLFLDADMCIKADEMLPFLFELESGADIVLNPLTRLMAKFPKRDAVSRVKEFLNRSLGRCDLGADSLTAVPHALSRRAIDALGFEVLAVPPLAQSKAIRSGLKFAQASVAVDVFLRNRQRGYNNGNGNPVEQMILGDHLEALHEAMKESGPRLGHP